MLDALAAKLGVAVPESPRRWRLQLWGAALPLNAWTTDANFAWDASQNIGVVGDWLATSDGPPPSTIEAAFASGDALGAHMAAAPAESRGLEGSFAAATTVFSAPAPASAASPAAAASPPAANARSDKEKLEKKLRKALKRIGQLRREDYMSLTTDQRVKIHGEPDVLAKLGSLGVDAEAVRQKLQPGLPPIPRSKEWSRERDDARDADKARRRRAARPGTAPSAAGTTSRRE